MERVQLDDRLPVDIIRIIGVSEVTITEATQESALVPNFEDLLDLMEMEGALGHVVLRVQWIVNARYLILGPKDIWNPVVEVLGLHHIARWPTHDIVLGKLEHLSIVVKEV